MSIVLSCDGCGAKISPEDLMAARAIEHQGTHYCERCKLPILSFLQKVQPASPQRVEAASGDPLAALSDLGSPLPARPPLKPPALQPTDLDIGEDLDSELAGLSRRPVGPVPAAGAHAPRKPPTGGPPAGNLPTSKLPAGKPGAAPKGAAPAPAPRPLLRPAVGQTSRAPGASALGASKPAPKTPGRAPVKPAAPRAAPPERTRFVPGAAQGQGKVGVPGGEPGAENEAAMEFGAPAPALSRKLKIIAGIGAAAVVALTGLFFAFYNRGDEPAPAAAAPVVQATPAVATSGAAEALKQAEDAARAAQRSRMEKLRTKLSDDPDKLLLLREDVEGFVILEAYADDHRQFVAEVDRRIAAAADRVLAEVQKKSDGYSNRENFVAASELWKDIPEIVRRSDRRPRWVESEVRTARYAQAWSLWTKVDKKADEYLGPKDATEIAIAILECQENYPKDCETLYPLIWQKRTERIQKLRNNAEVDRHERHKRESERRKQEEVARHERLDRERRALWAASVEKTPWMPLISRDGGDLENWSVRTSHPDFDNPKSFWIIQNIDGSPTIVGDNSGNKGVIKLGMNGNKWMDWLLEFDVLVEAGTLNLRTRTKLSGRGMGGAYVANEPKEFKFPAERYRSWKRVRIEASGNKVKWFEGENELDSAVTDEADDQYGGFVFEADPEATVKLREVKIKLIFSDKRKRGEDSGDDDDE